MGRNKTKVEMEVSGKKVSRCKEQGREKLSGPRTEECPAGGPA